MTVAVEIADVGNVNSQSFHGGNPGSTSVQAARFHQTLRKGRVEMRHHGLVTWQCLIAVTMRVGQYRIARLFRWSWSRVPIKRHSLPRSGWSVVERVDLFDPFVVIALFGRILSNAYPKKRACRSLAIPDIPQIDFQFPRKEDLVRRRKNGQRA